MRRLTLALPALLALAAVGCGAPPPAVQAPAAKGAPVYKLLASTSPAPGSNDVVIIVENPLGGMTGTTAPIGVSTPVSVNWSGQDKTEGTDYYTGYVGFTGSTFTNANFTWYEWTLPITNSDFTGANLTNAYFTDCGTLTGNKFVGVTASGTTFANANLTGSDFSGAKLTNVNFDNTTLTGCTWTGATFSGCTFTGATGAPTITTAAPTYTYKATLKTLTGWYVAPNTVSPFDVWSTSKTAGTAQAMTFNDLDKGTLEDGDQVQIKMSNGNYLRAENGGAHAKVLATTVTPGLWETFTLKRVAGSGDVKSGDTVYLKTSNGVNYVGAINGGNAKVTGARTALTTQEQFTITF